MHTGSEFLLNIIPKTFTAAFANGDILQVLLIAILFGVSLLLIPKHLAELVRQALEAFRKSSLKLWDSLFAWHRLVYLVQLLIPLQNLD